jgi:hypothetical protein
MHVLGFFARIGHVMPTHQWEQLWDTGANQAKQDYEA